jgi:hypothetical protein
MNLSRGNLGLRTWLRLRCAKIGEPSKFWLGKFCVPLAWAGLFAAVVFPPHGAGVLVCWFEGATGLPCPGCGMTRSLSCAVRGMFSQSLSYHPFGIFILVLFGGIAAQSVCPKRIREQVADFMRRHADWFNGFYVVFVVTFVAFGAVRGLWHLAHNGVPIVR